jgi:hypothetical protein
LEAEAVNPYKSTAGAAALVAIAELYSGIAALDVIDTTQLSAGGQLPPAATRERAKLDEARAHFASASDALARAIDVCAGFRPPAEGAPRSLADCNAPTFERLKAAVDRLHSARSDTLPALADLEAAIGAATAVATSWKDSAVGSRGTAGHYPAGTRP